MNKVTGSIDILPVVPPGVNRRGFLIRHAVIGAAAILTGQGWTAAARAQRAAAEASAQALGSQLSPSLNIVKQEKGPVLTVLEEFYKVGPGPSSSHTIGPMRITYDFYQRCAKLPAEQLAQATGLKVRLFGSLSATGKGHGTERASRTQFTELLTITSISFAPGRLNADFITPFSSCGSVTLIASSPSERATPVKSTGGSMKSMPT